MGKIIVVDGMSKTGKTSLCQMLQEKLRSMLGRAVLFKDTESTGLGRKVLQVYKDTPLRPSSMTGLFLAARAELYEVLRRAYGSPDAVILDRGILSTYVYQGRLGMQRDPVVNGLDVMVELLNSFGDAFSFSDQCVKSPHALKMLSDVYSAEYVFAHKFPNDPLPDKDLIGKYSAHSIERLYVPHDMFMGNIKVDYTIITDPDCTFEDGYTEAEKRAWRWFRDYGICREKYTGKVVNISGNPVDALDDLVDRICRS